ncbi:MAG TPA: hypothetical protein VGG16_14560 [Streptosporangiaceae bacterium]|jgi:hypothetical protein
MAASIVIGPVGDWIVRPFSAAWTALGVVDFALLMAAAYSASAVQPWNDQSFGGPAEGLSPG